MEIWIHGVLLLLLELDQLAGSSGLEVIEVGVEIEVVGKGIVELVKVEALVIVVKHSIR